MNELSPFLYVRKCLGADDRCQLIDPAGRIRAGPPKKKKKNIGIYRCNGNQYSIGLVLNGRPMAGHLSDDFGCSQGVGGDSNTNQPMNE